jgi:hypothetical protein
VYILSVRLAPHPCLGNNGGLVGGSVVYDDDFEILRIRNLLAKEREALGKMLVPVVRTHDNGKHKMYS